MRVLVIGGVARSLVNFRGQMLEAMVQAGHEVVACAGEVDDWVIERLDEIGVRFHGVTLERRGTSARGDWRYYKALRHVIASEQPDVVLSYTIKPVVYGSMAAARENVSTIAAMITGAGAARSGPGLKARVVTWIAHRLYAKALRHAQVVFFQNPDDEALFRKHRLLGSARILQIPGSGVDLTYYSAPPPATEPTVFLLIARLLPAKGIREYAQAAAGLRARFGDRVRCLLLGPYESGGRGITESEVQGWVQSGAIEYLGSVRDVRPHLAGASVYVLPSYYGEGQPRTVLEAMASGRAVITADAPGCRETVEDGVNGFLVPARDAEALERTMQRFVDEPEQITQMGQRSRERAEAVYDVHRVNETILRALDLSQVASSTQ